MNPITQMKQAKAKQAPQAQNKPTTAPKGKTQPTTATKAKAPQNANKGVLSLGGYFHQIARQFAMLKASAEHCKRETPEHFHFKLLAKKECEELAERLQMGVDLLKELAEISPLVKPQHAKFKGFMRGVGFMVRQLNDTAEHIEQVADGTNAKCYEKRINRIELADIHTIRQPLNACNAFLEVAVKGGTVIQNGNRLSHNEIIAEALRANQEAMDYLNSLIEQFEGASNG